MTDDLVLREAQPEDRRHVLALLARSLGWEMDSRNEELFTWKHEANAFGPSPAWVACHGERIVGFRTFLRWEFAVGQRTIPALRAVDTATDPEYRGRGVFRRLTVHALRELESENAEFIFNTPNDQSRPGYLGMGWQVVGRLRLSVRPTHPAGLVRMMRARRPADRWPTGAPAGDPARVVLDEPNAILALLDSQPCPSALATRRSPQYLLWRYGHEALGYRCVSLRGRVTSGAAIFRVRRRGPAQEAVLCEVLVPEDDPGQSRKLVREVARAAHADYVVRSATRGDACVSLPGQGPILTWRSLRGCSRPRRRDFDLTLGDLELM